MRAIIPGCLTVFLSLLTSVLFLVQQVYARIVFYTTTEKPPPGLTWQNGIDFMNFWVLCLCVGLLVLLVMRRKNRM